MRVVVEKRRRLVMWRNVRIHLDDVTGLGRFVEFEAVAPGGGGLEEDRARIEQLRAALGIEDDALLVARAYADLPAGRRAR